MNYRRKNINEGRRCNKRVKEYRNNKMKQKKTKGCVCGGN
jgi:hypothetical protein